LKSEFWKSELRNKDLQNISLNFVVRFHKHEITAKVTKWVRHLWLTPVILATWEAEIRRMAVQVQAGQKT
jgi:hypothetical protein